jgi:hypothetical protein
MSAAILVSIFVLLSSGAAPSEVTPAPTECAEATFDLGHYNPADVVKTAVDDYPPCPTGSACSPSPANPCEGSCVPTFNCTPIDTGNTACQIDQSTILHCPQGKTVHYNTCQCACNLSGNCRNSTSIGFCQ